MAIVVNDHGCAECHCHLERYGRGTRERLPAGWQYREVYEVDDFDAAEKYVQDQLDHPSNPDEQPSDGYQGDDLGAQYKDGSDEESRLSEDSGSDEQCRSPSADFSDRKCLLARTHANPALYLHDFEYYV